MKTTFDHFYRKVPAQQREDFAQFRQHHPLQTSTFKQTEWPYIDTQSDAPPLLILVGGLRMADGAFQAISALEKQFRIIAPSYPPLMTMADMSDGLAHLLQINHLAQVHLLAGSFGGMVAQVFARRYPQHIHKLVLSSTTSSPNSRAYKRQIRLLRPLPYFLIRSHAQRRLARIMAPPPDQAAFWEAYIHELFSQRLSKADLLSSFCCMVDFAENYAPLPAPIWSGAALLIGAEDDQTFAPASQSELQARFPHAHYHLFAKAGHSPSMTQAATYFELVQNFLHA